jgi:hypothetical protein
MFDAEMIRSLPADDDEAIRYICGQFLPFYSEMDNTQRIKLYDEFASALAFFIAFAESRSLKFNHPSIDASVPVPSAKRVIEYLKAQDVAAEARLQKRLGEEEFGRLREKYDAMFGGGFSHEFTESDISRIQELIDELRELITAASALGENHRGRLLRRLEKLQTELHKKVPDMDRFWGFVGDAGEAIGKFGKDAKPFLDRVREILELVLKAQAGAAQLPLTSLKNLLTFEEDGD